MSRPRYCQAQGCDVDVTPLGKYCIKRRLCPEHLKAFSLLRKRYGNQQWRFCQQCGKLELLSCFDGAKRSCRTQLARRRNPQKKQRHQAAAASSGAGDEGLEPMDAAPEAASHSDQGRRAPSSPEDGVHTSVHGVGAAHSAQLGLQPEPCSRPGTPELGALQALQAQQAQLQLAAQQLQLQQQELLLLQAQYELLEEAPGTEAETMMLLQQQWQQDVPPPAAPYGVQPSASAVAATLFGAELS